MTLSASHCMLSLIVKRIIKLTTVLLTIWKKIIFYFLKKSNQGNKSSLKSRQYWMDEWTTGIRALKYLTFVSLNSKLTWWEWSLSSIIENIFYIRSISNISGPIKTRWQIVNFWTGEFKCNFIAHFIGNMGRDNGRQMKGTISAKNNTWFNWQIDSFV